jgi:hypothetical protein
LIIITTPKKYIFVLVTFIGECIVMTLPVDKNSRLNIKPPEETAKKDEQKTKYANPAETNRHTPSESSDTYSNEQNIHNRIITEMTDTDSIEDDNSETQLLFTDEDFSCIDLDS